MSQVEQKSNLDCIAELTEAWKLAESRLKEMHVGSDFGIHVRPVVNGVPELANGGQLRIQRFRGGEFRLCFIKRNATEEDECRPVIDWPVRVRVALSNDLAELVKEAESEKATNRHRIENAIGFIYDAVGTPDPTDMEN